MCVSFQRSAFLKMLFPEGYDIYTTTTNNNGKKNPLLDPSCIPALYIHHRAALVPLNSSGN